jgi:branched-chain amino acid transport system permease protein
MLGQQILNGFVVGSVYALFALGFNLVFGVHKIMNLAHGAVFMTAAFVGLLIVNLGFPFWFAFILAMLAGGIISVLVDLLALRALRGRGDAEFSVIISTIGANLVLMTIAQSLSATRIFRFPADTFPIVFFHPFGLRLSLLQILIMSTVVVFLLLLSAHLYLTSFGRQVRAVAGNERAAALLGVNQNFVYLQTFFLSGVFAGAAGVLIGLAFNSVHFLMGEPYMLRAFVVLVLGGLGSLTGAVVAGLLLGILQNLTSVYLPTGYSDIIIFSLLFVTLVVMPNGLFGGATAGAGGRGR